MELLDLARLDALADALANQHAEAVEREASETFAEKIKEAIPAVEAFNAWFASEYTKHAEAIAQGLRLERIALAKLAVLRGPHGNMPPGLPASFASAKSLGFLVRLPAAGPGRQPPHWPN
jgi:hypothetical protein